ncbi:hypothetical protein [Streptomyces sp. NPDC015130]
MTGAGVTAVGGVTGLWRVGSAEGRAGVAGRACAAVDVVVVGV